MPGVYRKKECPNCKKEHRRRGPYCCKSCANLDRPPEIYEKHSEWMKNSEKGQEITYNLHYDPDYAPPVVGGLTNIRQDRFVDLDGDLWTSAD